MSELSYNTQQPRLIMPEYGRNIQKMVDFCLTIPDREKRTRCAYAIVASMANLFPELKQNEENRRKLWDHLAIMSNFQLDIDFPFEVVKADNLQEAPAKIPYSMNTIRHRQYGKAVEHVIASISTMDESPERTELIRLVANQMKKLSLAVNREGIDDAKVFKDLAEISHGAIRIAPGQIPLHEFKAAPEPTGKKKKKK